MPRRPASFTQADIARLVRGAREAGAAVAHIEMPSGVKFSIPLDKTPNPSEKYEPLDQESGEEAAFTI